MKGKFMSTILIIFASIGIATVGWFSFKTSKPVIASNSKPVTHQLWTDVLQKYVSLEGKVNYNGLKNDKAQFDAYLKLLGSVHPNDSWEKNEQLAYWINAYNAFTVELILINYPVKSIRDIGGLIKIPGIQSAWDIEFIKIEGREYSLGFIEHKILLKEFSEPRIHFAINCASYSCPKLIQEAYTPDKLDAQLTGAAKTFLTDPEKNLISPDKIEVSKIFDWYKDDFTKKSSLIIFLNKYSAVKIKDDAKIYYMEYNWNLNE